VTRRSRMVCQRSFGNEFIATALRTRPPPSALELRSTSVRCSALTDGGNDSVFMCRSLNSPLSFVGPDYTSTNAQCPGRVNRVISSRDGPLPLDPNNRTSSTLIRPSGECQTPTFEPQNAPPPKADLRADTLHGLHALSLDHFDYAWAF
jgi:hypothetical protein